MDDNTIGRVALDFSRSVLIQVSGTRACPFKFSLGFVVTRADRCSEPIALARLAPSAVLTNHPTPSSLQKIPTPAMLTDQPEQLATSVLPGSASRRLPSSESLGVLCASALLSMHNNAYKVAISDLMPLRTNKNMPSGMSPTGCRRTCGQ